ncbi:MAG: hypothetical protein MJ246_02935 [Clostridia bacterium]|nr:hypothetical protein [Clostridia bacterium]
MGFLTADPLMTLDYDVICNLTKSSTSAKAINSLAQTLDTTAGFGNICSDMLGMDLFDYNDDDMFSCSFTSVDAYKNLMSTNIGTNSLKEKLLGQTSNDYYSLLTSNLNATDIVKKYLDENKDKIDNYDEVKAKMDEEEEKYEKIDALFNLIDAINKMYTEYNKDQRKKNKNKY